MFVSTLPCALEEETPAALKNMFIIHGEHTLKTQE